jgi:hypothetical protein
VQDAHGRWRLQISAGGLVSALMGVNNYSTLWIGWPGKDAVCLAVPLSKMLLCDIRECIVVDVTRLLWKQSADSTAFKLHAVLWQLACWAPFELLEAALMHLNSFALLQPACPVHQASM